jgi:predicted nuclease of predicted toxin-antitoxin system
LQGEVVPKFLIDECLSPDLAALARVRGFSESSHVNWLGKAGWKDWELKRFILEQDWTFVTRNSGDFRGLATQPGSKGQYADVFLHAGLICISGPDSMSAENEVKLFGIVLDELGPVRWSIRPLRLHWLKEKPTTNSSDTTFPSPTSKGHDPPPYQAASLWCHASEPHDQLEA